VQRLLAKSISLYRSADFELFATDVSGVSIMEFADPEAGDLAWRIHEVLCRHTQPTNALERIGPGLLAVRAVDPLMVTVEATAGPRQTQVRFLSGRSQRELEGRALTRVDGVTPTRADVMEDAAAQAARSLRAHLLVHGIHEVTLRLAFGLDADGCMHLQVVNPRECDLGTTDYAALYLWLGGDEGAFTELSGSGDQAAAQGQGPGGL